MNDELQSAIAEEKKANAEHKKEETKKLKISNGWHRLGLKLIGFVTYVAVLAIGFVAGMIF